MIHLLYSSFEAILEACPDPGDRSHFGSMELEELSHLKVPVRIREWKASRIGAKLLVRSACHEFADLPFSSIQLIREPNGAPRLQFDGIEGGLGCFSQSHSNNFLFSAFGDEGEHLGVDLEKIEPRTGNFINDYFTPSEIEFVQNASADDQAPNATLIWSAKEAVLKSALLGLKVDTRRVEVIPSGNIHVVSSWQPAQVVAPSLEIKSPRLFWRRQDGFILTLCVDIASVIGISWVKI